MQEGLTESDAVKYLNDINYKDCVGKICKSKSSGDFKILKYNDRAKEVVRRRIRR